MKSILYIQHVPWGWIKQRPHFIAEHLSHRCPVDVFAERAFDKRALLDNSTDAQLQIRTLARLPLRWLQFIRAINQILARWQLAKVMANHEFVWVTHPYLFPTLEPALLPSAKLIYDCMDDALAFPALLRDPQAKVRLAQVETRLMNRADHILVSSENLKGKLIDRGALPSKLKLIGNAIDWNNGAEVQDRDLPVAISKAIEKPGCLALVYVGTISEWFDFPMVLECLERFPQTHCTLFGPAEIPIPVHERLHHFGPVEHALVMPILRRADLLIMPFRLNELVLSVDPVKLYEYIASGKTSLAVAYPETAKFNNFIHLYHDREEFFSIVERCSHGEPLTKANPDAIREFLEENTWASRCAEIAKWIGI